MSGQLRCPGLQLFCLALLLLCGCAADPPLPAPTAGGQQLPVQFTEVGLLAGLDHANVSGGPEQDYILETMSAGAAFLDYDGDGYLDVFLVEGTRLGGPPPGTHSRLYRNEQSGENRLFREVSAEAGVDHTGWGMGCAVGDYDNDGDPDLYATYWGPNRLYRNEGKGRFAEVGVLAGVADSSWSSSAAFGDLDLDGDLDLYVTNYLEFDLAHPPGEGRPCLYKGMEVFCGPKGMVAQPDRLYRNEGNGRFADMSAATGISRYHYPAMGVVFGDFDDDGDADIYVANDSEPNLLFRNDGNWAFAEVGALAGVAYSEDGRAQAGMGVHAGDFDNDKDLDLFVTNFSDDLNTLYQNQGKGRFVDVTSAVGLGGVARPFLGWSTGFFDFDNDGWLDLLVANGHLYPQLRTQREGLAYAQRNLLYWNRGGRFEEVGLEAGPGLGLEKVSRGAAFGDFDNDGDADVLVANMNDLPTLLRNDGGNRNNWLGLELTGSTSNRDAIGTWVRVRAGGSEQVREVQRGYGFQSQHDPRLLFGLGHNLVAEQVEIRWPSGQVQVLEGLAAGCYWQIREGGVHQVASYSPAGPVGSLAVGPNSGERPEQRRAPAPSAVQAGWKAEDCYRAGREYYKQGLYAEAVEALRRALVLQPDYLEVCVNLGVFLYSGLGDYEEAATVLEQAVVLDPERANTYLLLGKVYLALNRTAEAARTLERAVVLGPASWESQEQLGLAYLRQGRLKSALETFQAASMTAPVPRLHLHLAQTYIRLGRPEAAQREQQLFTRLTASQKERAPAKEERVPGPQPHR
ncbi:MAG: tetratricopeptide repeat protein [Candidatus Latescibacteria bacterium]|nr:tetratricopeptide repeat protein [Candidatus Latescibacterota bacterium]